MPGAGAGAGATRSHTILPRAETGPGATKKSTGSTPLVRNVRLEEETCRHPWRDGGIEDLFFGDGETRRRAALPFFAQPLGY